MNFGGGGEGGGKKKKFSDEASPRKNHSRIKTNKNEIARVTFLVSKFPFSNNKIKSLNNSNFFLN